MKKLFSTPFDEKDKSLLDLFSQETPVQRALREITLQEVEQHRMMTTPEQVQFLAFLMHSINARRAIEIGVFTGYGSLAIAQALPEDGELIACDHSDEWPSIGKPFWKQAGVADKIQLHIAPAVETLQTLLDEGLGEQFDFVFIDADKINYPEYAEFSYKLLRAGGLAVFDNVIWIGEKRVVEASVPATRAVSGLLKSMSADERFETTLVPIAQGMLLARKQGYND